MKKLKQMDTSSLISLVEVTRGPIVESIHFGAGAVVDVNGKLIASFGDPETVTFLRSASKPIQAIPFVESDGIETYNLTARELAIICASHSGTDEHVAVIKEMQRKIGLTEENYLCGVHPPFHGPTRKAMLLRHERPSPSRHNCSGKHTGMLALALMRGLTLENYVDPAHPVQQEILQAFSDMSNVPVESILLGIDGCSVPVYAVPLVNAAQAYARIVDPVNLDPRRAAACRRIVSAMQNNPDMVAGPDRFDTRLMEAGKGIILAKMGAEAYQLIGLMPGALAKDSPGVGIAYKIADGDSSERARPLVGIEILRQLGILSENMAVSLTEFDRRPIYNQRRIEVGTLQASFRLTWH